MGASQLKQDWKHHYTRLNQTTQPHTTIIQHNTTHKKFELITISIQDQTQKALLHQKLKNRQTLKPKFVRNLEQLYYKEVDQFCGTQSKFQLVFEFGSNRLQSLFNQRKNKKLTFTDQEIFYVIVHIFKGLTEVEMMREGHGNVNMHFILIDKQVKLEDPIVVEIDQIEMIQAKSSNIVYPSPSRLLSRVDSGMNIESFCEDLFSLGMVALQLYFPFENIKKVYKNKNTAYQNQRIDFNSLYEYLRFVKNNQLNECLRLLLSPLPNERTKVVSVLQNVNISMQNIKFLSQNAKVVTSQQELAQKLNPNLKANSQHNRPQLCFSQNKTNVMQSNSYYIPQQNYKSINYTSYNAGYTPLPQQQIQRPPLNLTFQPQQQQAISSQAYRQLNFSQTLRPKSYSQINFQNVGKRQIFNTTMINGNLNLPNNKVTKTQIKVLQEEQNKIQAKPQAEPITNQLQKHQKHVTPIKNLTEFISPSKDISLTLQNHNTIQNAHKHKNPNQNLSSLQQQLAQLELLSNKNEQLQQKLTLQVNNLFANKYSLPVHSDVIIQETFEDSKVEEPQYVVEEYQSGHKYQGYVLNNMRNGYGKFYYSGGSVYDGEWVNNKMCGYGQLFYPNGQLAYQGFFKNDEFEGKGTLKNELYLSFTNNYDYRNLKNIKSSEWKLYDGEWAKDKKQGKGRLTLSNNEVFQGEFKEDIPHGYGIFKQLNGTKIKGIWAEGILKSLIP